MKILIIDNYDSFTYNLLHYAEQVINDVVDVVRNDGISIEEINKYDKIILSPGPGLPNEAGITLDVIQTYASKKSILGVCLGHQAIAVALGGQLHNLAEVQHGVSSEITILADDILFRGIPDKPKVGRYHSWVISEYHMPQVLEVTARDESGSIMAMRHKTWDVRGVQFHPESIMTEHGLQMMRNWILS